MKVMKAGNKLSVIAKNIIHLQNSNKPVLKLVTIMRGHGDRNHTKGKRAYFKNGVFLDRKKFEKTELESMSNEAFYEGENNRLISDELEILLKREGIKYKIINPGDKRDMPRMERCKTANSIARKIGKKYVLNIAIHSDAFHKPEAHGVSCYTSPGQTPSDIYATEFYRQAKLMWPKETFREGRGDGDPDKEAKFTVLTKTASPSILPEFFFFTNYKDFTTHLKTRKGRIECATVLLNMIKQFYKK